MTDLTTMVRQEVELRLQDNAYFSLRECKILIMQVLASIAEEASRDFEQMMRIERLYAGSDVPPPAAKKITTTPATLAKIANLQGFASAADAAPDEKLDAIVKDIHLAILRIIEVAHAQRKDRLELIMELLRNVPSEDGSAPGGGTPAAAPLPDYMQPVTLSYTPPPAAASSPPPVVPVVAQPLPVTVTPATPVPLVEADSGAAALGGDGMVGGEPTASGDDSFADYGIVEEEESSYGGDEFPTAF